MSNKLSTNVKAFQKRWNATWDEATTFVQFKNRLLFLVENHFAKYVVANKELINQYAYICGIQAPYSTSARVNEALDSIELQNKGLRNTVIYSTFFNSQQPIHLAWYLQNLLIVLKELVQTENNSQLQISIENFYIELLDLLELSPSVQIRLSKTKKGIIVYPAGAKLLDERLVNESLTWLQEYPESLNAFEQALSIYLSGDKPKFRNLIDNLRVAIEQLLRRILNNQKSLEKQSKELDDWLEKHRTHKQVRNLYGQLLFGQYAALQNDVAKHGDEELLPDEIEYLIYLTGTFMRLIIQLRRSEA